MTELDALQPAGQRVYTAHGHHYAAFRLRRVLALSAMGQLPDEYLAGYVRRQTEFLTILLNPRDSRFTYDLRLISAPHAGSVSRGQVHMALLLRAAGLTAAEAASHAAQLERLLHAQFEECVFEPVPPGAVPALLQPFPIRGLVAITRRSARARLDSLRDLRRPRPFGFAPALPGPPSEVAPVRAPVREGVYHVYPLLPTVASLDPLLKVLLLERQPIALSWRLQPTALEPAEAAVLEQGIIACEQAAQIGLEGASADPAGLRPTLQEQARLYQRHLARRLYGLGDNAALLTVEAAAPEAVPVLLADLLGNLLTEPAGGLRGDGDNPARYLAGGYEAVDRSQLPEAIAAFTRLDLAPPADPLAPPGAERLLHLFDSVEAAAAFRLPRAVLEPPPGLDVQAWRALPPPRHLAGEGAFVGVSGHGRSAQPVRIAREDRRRHTYVVGQTGTGKTTLLKTMIVEDMQRGEAVCVIDPHGDLFGELLGLVPPERARDVVVLDPTDLEQPVGLNMLEYARPEERHFLVQEMVGIMARLLEDEYGLEASGQFAGPIFYQHMRMNLLLAMSNPDDPGTLLEFHTIFREEDYWRRWLPLRVSDPLLERWVTHVLPQTDYTRTRPGEASVGDYVASKFENFVFDPRLRNLFGQKRSSLNLYDAMNQGKIVLVNLARGELTDANARFLGMILLAKLQAAAMARVRLPAGQRREFYLYVDEFQNLATQNFTTLLSEARKFGVSLVLANQFISQVKDPRIVQAIFGNVGTLVCFRLGQADAEVMVRRFAPDVGAFDLVNLPNWEGYLTTLVGGQASRPFSLRTVPAAVQPDPERAAEVRAWSRLVYGRARHEVEAEIARSLAWSPPEAEPGEGRRRLRLLGD